MKAATIAFAVLASLVLAACGDDSSDPTATASATAAPAQSTEAPAQPTEVADTASTGLEGTSLASCAEVYTTATLPARTFAFDGTISAITPTDDPIYVAVTFEVAEWFKGDGPSEVVVGLFPPGTTLIGGPEYELGTRLLVTGEPRDGGTELNDLVAWYCGFTRTYDEATATEWRSAMS